MSPDRFEYSRPKEALQPDAISVLCNVLKLNGRRGNGLVFLGWNNEGKPIATRDEKKLRGEAAKSYQNLLLSHDLTIKTINNLSALVPVDPIEPFSTIGILDKEDNGEHKTEDSLIFSINSGDGLGNNISVGELEALSAIVEAKHTYWQDLGSADGRLKRMYCMFIKAPNMGAEVALAFMFRMGITQQSNEATFRDFVIQTLNKLLALDESKTPDERKGYLKTIKMPEPRKHKSFVQMFVRVSDQEAEEMEKKLKSIFINPTKEETLKSDNPSYSLESLTMDQLFSLAEEMKKVIETALDR